MRDRCSAGPPQRAAILVAVRIGAQRHLQCPIAPLAPSSQSTNATGRGLAAVAGIAENALPANYGYQDGSRSERERE